MFVCHELNSEHVGLPVTNLLLMYFFFLNIFSYDKFEWNINFCHFKMSNNFRNSILCTRLNLAFVVRLNNIYDIPQIKSSTNSVWKTKQKIYIGRFYYYRSLCIKTIKYILHKFLEMWNLNWYFESDKKKGVHVCMLFICCILLVWGVVLIIRHYFFAISM